MQVNVKAHGVLRPKVPAGPRELPEVTRVTDLIVLLGFAAGGVWMVLVNGAMADGDAVLHDGDRKDVAGPSRQRPQMAKWGGSEIPTHGVSQLRSAR